VTHVRKHRGLEPSRLLSLPSRTFGFLPGPVCCFLRSEHILLSLQAAEHQSRVPGQHLNQMRVKLPNRLWLRGGDREQPMLTQRYGDHRAQVSVVMGQVQVFVFQVFNHERLAGPVDLRHGALPIHPEVRALRHELEGRLRDVCRYQLSPLNEAH